MNSGRTTGHETGQATGHEAGHETGQDTAGTVVNYHFPVELHAVGSLPEAERTELAEQVFDRLGRELAGRL